MKYPYVVASQPVLILGERPPFSAQEFVFKCKGALSEEDLACLRALLAGGGEDLDVPFCRTWHRSERHLRLAVAQVRAGRLGLDMNKYAEKYRTLDPEVQRVVVDAFAKTNPLERERVIDEHRWRLLDELANTEPYGLAAVLAFAIRLQIADRWADFETERGGRAFEAHAKGVAERRETVGT